MVHISPGAPIWLTARVLLAERGDDLFQQWNRVRKRFDLEGIHDLRVSSRRLREALAVFSPCFPAKSLARLTSRVKKLTAILGTMRNTDEAILFFTPLVETTSGEVSEALQRLLVDLLKNREDGRKALKYGLKELDASSLRALLARTVDRPRLFLVAGVDPLMPIREYFRMLLAEREAAVARILPLARDRQDVASQHRLRIAVKHFRYRFELTAPLINEGFQQVLAVFKGYQEILGHLHDLDVFADLVRERLGDAPVAGQVQAMMAGKRDDLFAEFTAMLAENPLETLGERVLRIL